MSVSSYRELARSLEGSITSSTVARRRFVVILDDNATLAETTNAAIISAVGASTWGAAHPEFSFLYLNKLTLTENLNDSPYHVEVVLEYNVLSTAERLAPTSRAADWSYESTSGDQIPALYYYETNATLRPLTNSAYDYFEGLTVPESLTRITVKRNYAARPSALIGTFGFINSDTFDGKALHTCKHEGSKIEKVEEVWSNVAQSYWRAESQILFRPTGWNLQLPDVGFNFRDSGSGQKRRCMVFDFENSEWIPSPTPQGLNGAGAQTNSWPEILDRRIYPDASFVSLFGNPPA